MTTADAAPISRFGSPPWQKMGALLGARACPGDARGALRARHVGGAYSSPVSHTRMNRAKKRVFWANLHLMRPIALVSWPGGARGIYPPRPRFNAGHLTSQLSRAAKLEIPSATPTPSSASSPACATRRPAGLASRAHGEHASSTAGATSSSPGSLPAPSCPSGTILAIRRSPRGTPAARTRRSFAGRATEPARSSSSSNSRRGRKAIGSQTSTPSSRYTYGENAATLVTMAWGTLKKI